MSWDWDAEDIDPDEDDRKVWVPVTPKTGEGADMGLHGCCMDREEQGAPGRASLASQTMKVYSLSQDSKNEQAAAPVLCLVQTPVWDCPMIILANEESLVLSDLAVSDTDGKGPCRENLPGKGDGLKVLGRAGNKQVGQAIPKSASVVMSRMPLLIPCDRCQKGNKMCLPRAKGGKPLPASAGCHNLKMSCKTGEVTPAIQKKRVLTEESSGDSNTGDEMGAEDERGAVGGDTSKEVLSKDAMSWNSRTPRSAAVLACQKLVRFREST